MIKILHAADLHLDSPLSRDLSLRAHLLSIPAKLAEICRRERCDLVLLAGDLFDGPYTSQSWQALSRGLAQMQVPVFISPGNHDYFSSNSPYFLENIPENVHIFKESTISSLVLQELDCRIYGGAFQSMDCPALLENFRAEGTERYHIAVLHADPTQTDSPYCPVTASQIRESALDYLALGHLHTQGQLQAGSTLCAWPGCPMGRGFDEPGQKGVLLVTLTDTAQIRFLPLDLPQFHVLQAPVQEDPMAALEQILPPVGSDDHYRVTLTGECAPLDLAKLRETFSRFPHLELRDDTVPPVDLWANAGEDSLEGIYFGLLQQELETADAAQANRIRLAARISRKLLAGQEVALP